MFVSLSNVRRVLSAILAVCFCSNIGFAQVNHYVNPLDVSIADPHVLQDGGVYYLYGTANHGLGFPVYTSADLVHWTYRGLCWTKTGTSWAKSNLRAPEVMRVGNTYYLYYTGWGPENTPNVCVASANSPLGPFTDVKTPLLSGSLEYISGSPFRDPVTGKFFLYVVRESSPKLMFGVELTATPTATSGSLVQLFGTSQTWEATHLDGPTARYYNGYYYLAYSGRNNGTPDYAVGYATSVKPLGPFTKAFQNPIVAKTSGVSGPGHPTFAEAPAGNELFMLYHTNLVATGGAARQLAIDRVQFTPATAGGPNRMALEAGGPTTDLRSFPAGAAARQAGSTDTFGGAIDRQRWNVFEEDGSKWAVNSGKLSITAQDSDIRQERNDARNIFLQYAPPGNFDLLTEVTFSPMIANEQAFLILWSDQSNYVQLGTVYASGGLKIEFGVEKNGTYSSVLMDSPFGSVVRLKLERRGDDVTAYAGGVFNVGWTQVGAATTLASHQLQVGIGAISPGSAAGRVANFDHLTIAPPASVDDWTLY